MQRDFFNMQQLRAWCFSIGVGLVLSLLVRAFVFPIYQVPAHALLKQGDCVVVNKLARKDFQRGQLIVFGKTPNEIGRIKALPGDTLRIRQQRYVIPSTCCKRCLCTDCHTFLVQTGNGYRLIQQHQIIGKAYWLYHLPF